MLITGAYNKGQKSHKKCTHAGCYCPSCIYQPITGFAVFRDVVLLSFYIAAHGSTKLSTSTISMISGSHYKCYLNYTLINCYVTVRPCRILRSLQNHKLSHCGRLQDDNFPAARTHNDILSCLFTSVTGDRPQIS